MASLVASELLRSIGADGTELYCPPDGNFPNHHPDPTIPENLKDLISTVREKHAEVGLAFDGDSDRLGVVDENGNILWGDQLLIIFARDALKKRHGGTIIFEVKCSKTLEQEIRKSGGNPLMWKAGHSLIKSKMKAQREDRTSHWAVSLWPGTSAAHLRQPAIWMRKREHGQYRAPPERHPGGQRPRRSVRDLALRLFDDSCPIFKDRNRNI
jgi:hypothetical protein